MGFGTGMAFPSGAPRRFHGDEAAGLDDPVEGRAVDDQILDNREGPCAPGFDDDLVAVLEAAHVQLAHGDPAQRPVSPPVDVQAAGPADPFAAVVIERDGILTLPGKFEVEEIQHLQERHVRRHVVQIVRDQLPAALFVFLTPHPQS